MVARHTKLDDPSANLIVIVFRRNNKNSYFIEIDSHHGTCSLPAFRHLLFHFCLWSPTLLVDDSAKVINDHKTALLINLASCFERETKREASRFPSKSASNSLTGQSVFLLWPGRRSSVSSYLPIVTFDLKHSIWNFLFETFDSSISFNL